MDFERNPTEAGWLMAENPGLMLAVARQGASDRRLRLVAVACCRAAWPHLPPYPEEDARDAECLALLELAERYADGTAKYGEMMAARRSLAGTGVPRGGPPGRKIAAAWFASAKDPTDTSGYALTRLLGEAWRGRSELEMPSTRVRFGWLGHGEQTAVDWVAACMALVAVVRDVFGNPFRKVKFDKKWRTDTAVALARQMYDSRDFSAMPILADALQDAGCENEDILTHCRDTAARHARGCWVCDLVLGKS
jgi:hypothetical protein